MSSSVLPQSARSSVASGVLPWMMVSAALLGTVALVNGYPLVFPDTGTYIRQALKLEGALDRPPYYSLFLVPLHWRISLWPVPFVQDIVVCYVVFRAFSIAFPALTAPRLAFAVMLAGAATSLPWFSNQIMPDIFTPLALLLVFCLCLGWEGLTRLERVAMPAMLLAMSSFHTASTIFVLGIGAAALLLAWRRGPPRRAMRRGALLVAAPVILAVAAQSLYGYAVIGRITPSPGGPFFALARLIADGPARRYLAGACPAAEYVLCRHLDGMKGDHNAFLWNPDSPLQAMIRERREEGALREASAIVAGTLAVYPGQVLANAGWNAIRQLAAAATTDVDCPCIGGKVDRVVAEFFPHEHGAFVASRQNQDGLPWRTLTWFHGLVAAASAVGLSVAAVRRSAGLAGDAGRLLVLIAWGLALNAGLMGALSGVADRYEARLVWLLPLFAAALLLSEQAKRFGSAKMRRAALQ